MTQASHPVPVPEGDGTDHPLRSRGLKRFDDQPVAENRRGLQMPRLGFGTWRLEGETAREMTEAALEVGYRHLDTAQMYENEAEVGQAITASGISRDEIFLTTKVDNDSHDPDDLVRSVHASLERLGTDHVDLLLIHWPVEWPTIGATLGALANVHAAGLADHIGVSNFTADQLDQVGGFAPIEVLQVECHPYLQQRELRDWCHRNDLLFTAYTPLARGELLDDPVLQEIGTAHGVSPTTAALGWLCSLDGVTAIPRTSNRDHLVANWEGRRVEPSDDERRRIADLDRGHRLVNPDFAPW